MKDYETIIYEEIERIKQLHGLEDPYYKAIIRALLSDLSSYKQEMHWKERGYEPTYFEHIWRKIIEEFFSDIL
ncbi:MAG: hypothetical protein QXK24_00060 [Ignisphaera sp.]